MKMRTRAVVITLMLLCSVLPSAATTLTVTSLADDGSPGTLRSTITSAAPGDVITFAVSGTITLSLGTIEINKNVTISGINPSRTIIDGNHRSTVLQIDSEVSVSIIDVTVQGKKVKQASFCVTKIINATVKECKDQANLAFTTLKFPATQKCSYTNNGITKLLDMPIP